MPFSLSDNELQIAMPAARPIQPRERDAFLREGRQRTGEEQAHTMGGEWRPRFAICRSLGAKTQLIGTQ